MLVHAKDVNIRLPYYVNFSVVFSCFDAEEATCFVNARTEKDATTWIQNLEEHTTTTF